MFCPKNALSHLYEVTPLGTPVQSLKAFFNDITTNAKVGENIDKVCLSWWPDRIEPHTVMGLFLSARISARGTRL